MAMETFPITQACYTKMEAELKRLKTEDRPVVIQAIADAREHGDLKENAEYHAAREKQGFIEARISDLEARISHAEIVDISQMSGNTVKFGATVLLVDEDTDKEVTYQIVGEYEADLDKGKISLTAPIARALIGKEVGDSIEVNVPGGTRFYEILKVAYNG
jgi:transcription elongation factor GreA